MKREITLLGLVCLLYELGIAGCKDVINLIDGRVKWLKTKWGNGKPDPGADIKTMTQGSASCHRKVLENNQLLIRVNGSVYTMQGTRVE